MKPLIKIVLLLFIPMIIGSLLLTAQDGESEKEEERRELERVQRFARVDRVATVIWPIKTQGRTTLPEAAAFCQNSKLGMFSDWRLPTKAESLVLFQRKKRIRLDFAQGLYWLSDTDKEVGDSEITFDFNKGQIRQVPGSESHSFRCVRDKNGPAFISWIWSSRSVYQL
jgi:Protein of unknown function (DUF1566)